MQSFDSITVSVAAAMKTLWRSSLAALSAMLVGMLLSTSASGHHSFAKFDQSRTLELEGEVVDVSWRNPHVHLTVRGRAEGGPVRTWDLETSSPGILRRMGVDARMVEAGSHVRVAGNPAVDGGAELFAQNVLLADGRELLLGISVEPVFAAAGIGDAAAWLATEGDTSRPELGLFRVWSSTIRGALTLFPGDFDYPLTDAARRAVDGFDQVAESRRIADDCTPKGMPWIMEQPYDIKFEQAGDDIVLRLEEFDTARRIHMGWQGDRTAQAFSIHGFSTGVWDGGTLVVTTTNLNSKNFKWEIPATERATIVERFTPSSEGDRLDYEITVTDPGTFTEPVTLNKFWLSIPGQVLDAYNCGVEL